MESEYSAVKVMYAIHSVFADAGNEQYAESKTNNFLKRCGADINRPKEQLLDANRIKEVVYAMLDAERAEDFWQKLGN